VCRRKGCSRWANVHEQSFKIGLARSGAAPINPTSITRGQRPRRKTAEGKDAPSRRPPPHHPPTPPASTPTRTVRPTRLYDHLCNENRPDYDWCHHPRSRSTPPSRRRGDYGPRWRWQRRPCADGQRR